MSTSADGDATTNKKRKVKDLPEGLSYITADNLSTKARARWETDEKESGEVMVVYEIMLDGG